MSFKVLACRGGVPVRTISMPSWPQFDKDEIDAVTAVLASGKVNYWTGGVGRNFEIEYARSLGVSRAIALSNGTVALELGLRAFGIAPGDDVVVPAKTFIASASAVVACGARPVVADVDEQSQNLTVETIRAALTPNTKAIIVVHLGGWPADMPSIMEFAVERGLVVVEDCAQAHGAAIHGRQVGSFGDCAAFSFCQDKIITTGGEGGLLAIRDNDAAWRRAWAYKDHGKSLEAVYNRPHPPGFRWLHESFGTNMRMTEMQAAIGTLQLAKLPRRQAIRAQLAKRLHSGLSGTEGLITVELPVGLTHAWYRYYVFLDLSRLLPEWTLAEIIAAIAAEGVPCFVGSCSEIQREEAFERSGYKSMQSFPVAAQLSMRSLAFLVHPTLSAVDIDDTIAAVRKVMAIAVAS